MQVGFSKNYCYARIASISRTHYMYSSERKQTNWYLWRKDLIYSLQAILTQVVLHNPSQTETLFLVHKKYCHMDNKAKEKS